MAIKTLSVDQLSKNEGPIRTELAQASDKNIIYVTSNSIDKNFSGKVIITCQILHFDIQLERLFHQVQRCVF